MNQGEPMKSPQMHWIVRTTLSVALALAATGMPLVAQTAPEVSFLRALSDHHELPAGEASILAEWRIPVADVATVLFIAERASVSPDVVVSGHRAGRSWLELARRYGLDATVFLLDLSPPPPPLQALQARLDAANPRSWGAIEITDAEAVFLVNARFLAEYLGMSPTQAAEALERHGSAAEALRAIGG
jgi:hypothetical protein